MLPSQSDIDFFNENGVVCLRNALSHCWVEMLQRGFEKNLSNPSPYACCYTKEGERGLYCDDYCNWQRIDEFREAIFRSNLADIAGRLLKAKEIRLFHEHIFFKQANTTKKTPWHQDLPYYCVDGDQGVSLWIPLLPVDDSNMMEFIAGSHRWEKLFAPKKFNGLDTYDVPQELYAQLPDIEREPDNFKKLGWTMHVGDILAFDFRTVHGNTNTAQPNLFDRRVISVRFLGENMRYSGRPGEKSPPFSEVNLKPGDVMAHHLFPIVWRSEQ